MKGTIVKCMEELVTGKFGAPKWKESLAKAGIAGSRLFSTVEDVLDAEVLKIVQGIAEALALPAVKVMEAFGEHWSTVYAPSIYKSYFPRPKAPASCC